MIQNPDPSKGDAEEIAMHADMLQRMAERLLRYAEDLRARGEELAKSESQSSAKSHGGRPAKGIPGGGESEGELF